MVRGNVKRAVVSVDPRDRCWRKICALYAISHLTNCTLNPSMPFHIGRKGCGGIRFASGDQRPHCRGVCVVVGEGRGGGCCLLLFPNCELSGTQA